MFVIRITSVPKGEAPLEIREDWVGCLLPVANSTVTGTGEGVITGEPDQGTFYAVWCDAAIEALESQRKFEAADWWRSLKIGDDYLLFHVEECEITTPD